MKKYWTLAILLLILTVLSVNNVLAVGGRPPSVGVPLDGGLLAILGAAGVAYFTARKKKKE